jgi:hypothetical protein
MWEEWIANSPWSDDPFLTDRLPVGVSVRYGQDIPICRSLQPNALQRELDQWDTDRIWRRLRYLTFALATHIS